MSIIKTIAGIKISSLFPGLVILLLFNCLGCHGDRPAGKRGMVSNGISDSIKQSMTPDEYRNVNAMLVIPKNPNPGEPFRILATGGEYIRKAQIIINSASGSLESLKSKTGDELSGWRIDDFRGSSAG
ncbi:MAG: hypothetical protein EPN88_14455, partial [Bacteroidetes bacterium]